MTLGVRQPMQTVPYTGSFSVTSAIGQAGNNYPDTGYGASTTTAGNAHWTDLGLAAGTFEVEVTGIILATGCTLTLTEIQGTGVAHYFQAGATVASSGTGNPWGYLFPEGTGPRFRDGFKYTLTSAGGTIFYKIHTYFDASPE